MALLEPIIKVVIDMDFSRENRAKHIKDVLEKNGLTLNDFESFLLRPLNYSSKLYRTYKTNSYTYGDIANCFIPNEETISMDDIVGLEFNTPDILEALLTIYRFESLYENLGNFNFEKYYESLNNSNFTLTEKGGKYYVYGDGNHRALLMLFQYNLEIKKLEKAGTPMFMIQQLKDKLKIKAPVIHLKHNKDFLDFIINSKKEHDYLKSSRSGIQSDFMNSHLPEAAEDDFLLQLNNDSKTYNFFYKGFLYRNLTDWQVVDSIKKVNGYGFKNDFLACENGKYIISNNHFGMENIPNDKVLNIDDSISQIEFPNMSFGYFIKNTYPSKTFSIDFEGKDYGDEKINHSVIRKFVEDNADLLYSKRKDYQEEILTNQNYLNDLHFENLSFERMIEVVNIMKSLDDLILNNKTKKRI